MGSGRMWMVALVGLVLAGNAAGEYDFFNRAVYPGPIRKPGVDLYEVKEPGDPAGGNYRRRVVHWWPRKGVDTVEVRPAMPLRTWTLRERKMDPAAIGEHLILGIEALTRRAREGRPRRFKAHLVGFRGLGNRYGNPFEPGAFYCPAVVLRLEDGSLRCFTRGTLVEADEKFALALYLKEIDRIRAALPQTWYELGDGVKRGWPNNAKPGQPGTMRVESPHFVWVSGSQHAPNEKYSPWVNRDAPDKARLYREGSVAFAEDMWTYQEHAGALMPSGKYVITVCGTYRDGHKWLGGYAGGGRGGCGVKYAGGGPWGLTLAHEWGHGLIIPGGVHGEILSDACSAICDPASPTYYNNAKRPWRYCFHGSYGTGLFYAIMGQDPNWGYTMAITLPTGKDERFIFHTLARVGEQRGLFAHGIRGVGDMMGEFTARQAEFDCEIQENLRRDYISVKRNSLEAVDRTAGLYRIPWGESPEAFGANIIRLVPAEGAEKIAVDLRGFYNPAAHGDWRACIVVAGARGKVRYSPLWSKGPMAMAIRPDDRRFWLTVAATPSALPPALGQMLSHRYPYEVELTACRPGTPHNLPGDVEDYGLTYLGGWRDRFYGGVCVIPHPGDTPEARIMARTLPRLRAEVDKVKQETQRLVRTTNKIDTDHWRYLRRFKPHLEFLDKYVDWMQDGLKGRRHPNGGGWVSASAQVAPSAYVAPDAMVLYGAKVLDQAAIEDYAVVRGPRTVVSGHAKISGQAYVAGNVKIGGYTRVTQPIIADDRQVVANEVPMRPSQEEGDGEKLWAYYAMNASEALVLEDWFPFGGGLFNLNGRLYGKPGFVVDGDRRGFAFDGKTQYAEASPHLADLGQITVELALKWEGQGAQTILDFGSSPDNCFVLKTAQTGKAELVAKVGGRTVVSLTSSRPLPKDKWVSLRLEMDGTKASLWIDEGKVAEKASTFRPADVYPAGVEKRNFLAASRNATAHFKGTIDYLRVYHTVFDDFPGACRKDPKELQRAAERREALIKAKVDSVWAYYKEMGARRSQLEREIQSSTSPEVTEANKKLGELRQKLNERSNELRAEFEKLPETIRKRAESRKLEDKARELDAQRAEATKALKAKHKSAKLDGKELRSLITNDPKVAALVRASSDCRTRARAIRPDPRDYVEARTVELRRKVANAEAVSRDAVQKNLARFKPELDWLQGLGWLVFSRHYNYPYHHYLGKKFARDIGGKPVFHENPAALDARHRARSETAWRTRCDWDWRLAQEADGSITKQPMLQKWLKRVRGPVVTKKPESVK